METLVLKVAVGNFEPDSEPIRRAAAIIRAGGLVAFPTETVYGLGANALDPLAVARVFEAKGRPATNPVIVHLFAGEVSNVATNWPETAAKLAARFWPGPLTLVVPRSERVPDIVSAGGPTVAVRCPNHPVAQALIRAAGVPIAAPSANRSTELSPTRAEHVLKGLNGRIELVLDGGPCPGGIESTVVDVTGEIPRVLRPGLITVPMLEEVCGRVKFGATEDGVARSPGQMAKHYSPKAQVVLCESREQAERLWNAFQKQDVHSVIIGFGLSLELCGGHAPPRFGLDAVPDKYAADLYAALHAADNGTCDRILVEMPPNTPEWAAVRDRLTRAAASG